MSSIKEVWAVRRFIFAWIIPLILLPIPLIVTNSAGKCAYVVFIMAIYWFTEAIPMSVTALLPMVLFPILGVLSSDLTSKAYVNGTIMIFLGSLIAATALEKSDLHKRIALKVILLTGTSPKRLLFGFMFTAAFLSMWISNLASTALMIPIVNAALEQLKQRKSSKSYGTLGSNSSNHSVITMEYKEGHYSSKIKLSKKTESIGFNEVMYLKLRKAIFLGICYAANIGGTGTLTGTSTNLILNGILKENPISFSDWIIFNVPGMLILVFIAWLFIIFVLMRNINKPLTDSKDSDAVYKAIKVKYDELGSITFHESAVLILFMLLLLLWFFRDPDFLKGWAPYLNEKHNFIKDSSPAIFIAILFFLIPANPTELKTSPMLLDWKTTQDHVSWGVLLLLGGGFAMAEGAEVSGLSNWMGTQLTILEGLPHFMIVIIVCLFALMLTEIASNTATCTILLPVIKRMAIELNMSPLSVMLPVTLSCSYAFMLPVATGPNAIIFEVTKMKPKEMMIPGFFMKFICLTVTLIMLNTWGEAVLDLHGFHLNQTSIDIANRTIVLH